MGMMEKFRTNLRGIKRYHQKCRIKILVSKLPVEIRSKILYSLLEILDIPDRREKIRGVREIFKSFKDRIENIYKGKITSSHSEFLDGLKQAAGNILPPALPMLRISTDHDILEEKAKAKMTLLYLEDHINAIPQTKKSHLYWALLGILLSAVANFLTMNAFLGNDWIGGNEMVSTICNGIFALLFIVFESIGLYLFLHFLPPKYSPGLVRLFGLLGTAILVLSIFLMIFTRTEIGTNILTTIQEIGKVE